VADVKTGLARCSARSTTALSTAVRAPAYPPFPAALTSGNVAYSYAMCLVTGPTRAASRPRRPVTAPRNDDRDHHPLGGKCLVGHPAVASTVIVPAHVDISVQFPDTAVTDYLGEGTSSSAISVYARCHSPTQGGRGVCATPGISDNIRTMPNSLVSGQNRRLRDRVLLNLVLLRPRHD
jgi:hypothetical protein